MTNQLSSQTPVHPLGWPLSKEFKHITITRTQFSTYCTGSLDILRLCEGIRFGHAQVVEHLRESLELLFELGKITKYF